MSDTLDTLRAARKLIEKPENWCKTTYARNIAGEAVDVESADALAHCAIGALYRVSIDGGVVPKAFMALHRALPSNYLHIPAFNDHPDTTHPMVLDLLDRAIAAEEANG